MTAAARRGSRCRSGHRAWVRPRVLGPGRRPKSQPCSPICKVADAVGASGLEDARAIRGRERRRAGSRMPAGRVPGCRPTHPARLSRYLEVRRWNLTSSARWVGRRSDGAGGIQNPQVMSVCGSDDENRFVLTFDNRAISPFGHPASHNCGGVHTCTLEPDTHISAVRINGVNVDPCDTAKPSGQARDRFRGHRS